MSKFELSPLNIEFRNTKENYPDFFKGKVVLGVSGGPDSMCLLYLLHRHQVQSIAVHCNYQLRGKSSDQDQQLVEEVCSMWGIDCVSVRLNPDEAGGQNFQAWARDERYRIFREIKENEDANLILTAHHQDDQIETILQKILRGSGMGSWKGMKQLDQDLMRPLLNVSKAEIMEFVQSFHVPYRIDSTNDESTYARNFIRNNWFPELNSLFPGWKENLLQIQDRAIEFELMADYLIDQLCDGGPIRMNRDRLLQLNRALWPVVIHRCLQKMDQKPEISRKFLFNVADLENLQTGKSIQISEAIHLMRDRSFFVFQYQNEGGNTSSESAITEPIPVNGIEMDHLKISSDSWNRKISANSIQMDYDKLKFPLNLRCWKDGDRIRPLGMDGSQLISDLLTNNKISAIRKKEAKVLTSFDGTIYAVIFPNYSDGGNVGVIADAVKCGPNTQKILKVRNI